MIGFYEFATGAQRALARLTGQVVLDPVLAPDGSTLLCCRADRLASDLMIVDHFGAE